MSLRPLPMVNGRAWEFGDDDFRCQVINLYGSRRVSLYYRMPGDLWTFGHFREADDVSDAAVQKVAQEIYDFMMGP